ncbi:MAG: thioesterase family protein [Prevotellaceae bacterium]|jgi:predicted thioesterase|nr:thioesterase family protein [Prevotellaceae bacterium]
MEHTLQKGMSLTVEIEVTQNDTALKYDSGFVEVFATPAMIALMESAAYRLATPHLPEEYGTVGIEISTTHTKATPVGMKVEATATLVSLEGRILGFEVVAKDEEGEIGRGNHIRSIINTEKFMAKLKK